MNKFDIAGIRKELKPDNVMLNIKDLYSVYLKKDNKEEPFKELTYFNMMDSEKKDLYLKNFKKVLSGAIDTKLFEIDFKNKENKDDSFSQSILYKALNSDDKENFKENLDSIVKKIADNFKYEGDIVINFARAEYFKPVKKVNEEADESKDDDAYTFKFILCSVNKVEFPKTVLKLDYLNKQFMANSSMDCIINMDSPIEGFMFPCFNDNSSDVNRVLYYSGKAKGINIDFAENVLDCSFKKTAKEEKEEFTAVLKTVIGEEIEPETMHDIYNNLEDKMDDEEDESGEIPKVDMQGVKEVLENSGVDDTENLEDAFVQITGDKNSEFKIPNIMPDLNKKSIKIEGDNLNISLAPKDLKNIRQVKDEYGRKCLLIVLTEDISVEGFSLKTEDDEN